MANKDKNHSGGNLIANIDSLETPRNVIQNVIAFKNVNETPSEAMPSNMITKTKLVKNFKLINTDLKLHTPSESPALIVKEMLNNRTVTSNSSSSVKSRSKTPDMKLRRSEILKRLSTTLPRRSTRFSSQISSLSTIKTPSPDPAPKISNKPRKKLRLSEFSRGINSKLVESDQSLAKDNVEERKPPRQKKARLQSFLKGIESRADDNESISVSTNESEISVVASVHENMDDNEMVELTDPENLNSLSESLTTDCKSKILNQSGKNLKLSPKFNSGVNSQLTNNESSNLSDESVSLQKTRKVRQPQSEVSESVNNLTKSLTPDLKIQRSEVIERLSSTHPRRSSSKANHTVSYSSIKTPSPDLLSKISNEPRKKLRLSEFNRKVDSKLTNNESLTSNPSDESGPLQKPRKARLQSFTRGMENRVNDDNSSVTVNDADNESSGVIENSSIFTSNLPIHSAEKAPNKKSELKRKKMRLSVFMKGVKARDTTDESVSAQSDGNSVNDNDVDSEEQIENSTSDNQNTMTSKESETIHSVLNEINHTPNGNIPEQSVNGDEDISDGHNFDVPDDHLNVEEKSDEQNSFTLPPNLVNPLPNAEELLSEQENIEPRIRNSIAKRSSNSLPTKRKVTKKSNDIIFSKKLTKHFFTRFCNYRVSASALQTLEECSAKYHKWASDELFNICQRNKSKVIKSKDVLALMRQQGFVKNIDSLYNFVEKNFSKEITNEIVPHAYPNNSVYPLFN